MVFLPRAWYNSNRCAARTKTILKELLYVDSISLFPGEERCISFRDADGVPKVRYTYCSLHGRLFNCTCRSKDEAQRLCEDWLVTQDRGYIN